MIHRFVAVILLLITASVVAWAQSGPGWQHGKIPTATEWETQWESKLDSPTPGSAGNLMTKSGAGLGTYGGSACAAGEVPNGFDANGAVTGCAIAAAGSVANPSGLIGMNPANGVATTAGRSDGTHAIDPAIAPTWTGLHTFNGGLTGSMTDPTISGDLNDRWLGHATCTYDERLNLNTGFTDANCFEIVQNSNWAMNSYGGGTNAKWSTIALSVQHNAVAAGQRFALDLKMVCMGMGDCFNTSRSVVFGGADIAGDEGQGFEPVNYITQSGFNHIPDGRLAVTTISGVPVRSSCNTTLSQGVTGSQTAQAVSVASTAGCVVNDWVVVDTELPTSTPNHEAVQITAVGGGKITGVFRNNHTTGHAVTPALKMVVSDQTGFGQGRVLVDLSGVSYSTGTVSAISGGSFTGSGTTWTTAIVGDNGTNNIGCIALTADDFTGAPFNGSGAQGTLKSWYQLFSVSSNTSLGIYKISASNDAGYNGNWTAGSSHAYIIRPCAEILVVQGNTIILSTSAATWTNGDTVEATISPYPDVTGSQEHYAVYTPGGALRAAKTYINTGARSFDTAITVDGNMPVGGGADTIGWKTGAALHSVGVGLEIAPTQLGIQLPATSAGAVHWGSLGTNNAPVNQYIGYASVNSTAALLLHGVNGTGGAADRGSCTLSAGAANKPWFACNGQLGLVSNTNSATSTRMRFFDEPFGDPGASTNYLDMRYVDGNGNANGQNRYWATNWGLIFSSTNSNYPSGHDLFVIAGDANSGAARPAVGIPELETATNGANQRSGMFRHEASVWNGSAARATYVESSFIPADNTTNARTIFVLDALADVTGCSYNIAFPARIFQVNDQGKLTIGQVDGYGCGFTTPYSATIDPTGLTASRAFTLPDIGGELTPTTGSKTTGKCLMFNASGQIIVATTTVCS